MSETTTTQAVVKSQPREVRVVHDDSEISYLMDTARFDHLYRIAGGMARASLIPSHLKGTSFEETQANCFLVVNQAMRWKLDPFAIAPETYAIGGKLAFQGKLVAAVINARGNLAERLTYTFNDAKGDALEVTVSGRLEGEEKPRTVTVSVGQAKTSNQMWTKDPHQKLIYTGAIKWARRHKPEVILGVLTDDDADAIREEARFIAAKAVKSPEFSEPPLELTEGTPTPRARKKKETTHVSGVGEVSAEAAKVAGVDPATPVVAQEQPANPPATPSAPANELSFEQVVDGADEPEAVKALRAAMVTAEVSESQVLAFCEKSQLFNPSMEHTLPNIRADKMKKLTEQLKIAGNPLAPTIKGMGA